MLRFLIDNVLFLGSLVAAFTLGVFVSSQSLKDWLKGTPAALRKTLNEQEAYVKKAIADAQAKAIAESSSKIVVAAPAPAPAPAPVAEAPAPAPAPAPAQTA